MNPDAVQKLDAADPLASRRAQFQLPADTIYLNGNSLGPLSKAAKQRLSEVMEIQWGQGLINSWNQHHWIDLPLTTGNKIAALIGAKADEVICCDSVSINLFKVLNSALQLQTGRSSILTQKDNFPTDLYIADGLSKLLGEHRARLEVVEEQQLEAALTEKPAVLMLTQVNFRSGSAHDIERITALAHAQNCLVIWDLSHSVGVLPLQLSAWNVDFAVGCGYKYLNGGPGAPAFIYANSKHLDTIQPALAGWMGHQAPFEFDPKYTPDTGIRQYLCGTPPILSMSALDAALDSFSDVDSGQLWDKARQLSQLFLNLRAGNPGLQELTLISPEDPELRGAQLGFSHNRAYEINRALDASGVVTDFRSPNILRLGFSPLFLRYADVYHASTILAQIMTSKSYKDQTFSVKNRVT